MTDAAVEQTKRSSPGVVVLAWMAVGLPLLWGVVLTLKKALALFK
jgi:hypothetical protein